MTNTVADRFQAKTRLFAFSTAVGLVLISQPPFACGGTVTIDGSLGNSGTIGGPNYDIASSVGKIRGKNLFHSFNTFDIDAGETAAFFGPAKIRNILVRVTGGNPSSIDGTVRSDIAGAGFYFLNPAGVIFGPNVSLDVSGSFAASSSDFFRLESGVRFGVGLDPSADSKLTTGPVVGFGFLSPMPGTITVQGELSVSHGNNITLVGGDIVIDGGQLTVPDGRVNLVSALDLGEVTFQSPDGVAVDIFSSSSKINMREIDQRSSIDLTDTASVDVSGAGGGKVVIRGGRLTIDNGSISSDSSGNTAGSKIDIHVTSMLEVVANGQITTETTGPAQGGDIGIRASTVIVDGQDLDATLGGESPNGTRIAADTSSSNAKAKGGNVVIHTDVLELIGGGEIATSSRGAADAGKVSVTATSLTLSGSTSFTAPPTWIRANASPFTSDAGNGGDIAVNADSILIENGALINADTQGAANAGRIALHANSLVMVDGAVTTRSAGRGQGGTITVEADQILMDGVGAFLGAETSGKGRGGDIDVMARSILILNDAAMLANSFGVGDSGNITVRARLLELDGATIPSGIIAFSAGSGSGGKIAIDADILKVLNGMEISSSSFDAGDGGNITIQADSVELNSGGAILSSASGSGVAGGIEIDTSDLRLSGGSLISVAAAMNEAGSIDVLATGSINVNDSQISAEAFQASGGSIQLFSLLEISLNNAFVLASAQDNGGNIGLGAPYFIYDPFFSGTMDALTTISANAVNLGGNINISKGFKIVAPQNITATGAQQGNVDIGGPDADLSGSLVGLPVDMLDADSELRPDCGVRLTGGVSSFTVMGRGGLPLEPSGLIPSSQDTDEDAGD